jgi:hypothetical protein
MLNGAGGRSVQSDGDDPHFYLLESQSDRAWYCRTAASTLHQRQSFETTRSGISCCGLKLVPAVIVLFSLNKSAFSFADQAGSSALLREHLICQLPVYFHAHSQVRVLTQEVAPSLRI